MYDEVSILLEREDLETLAEVLIYMDLLSSVLTFIIFYERKGFNFLDNEAVIQEKQALQAENKIMHERMDALEDKLNTIEELLKQILYQN